MAEITSSMVMELRKLSGQGMMDCKAALSEANGDPKKAMEILRKKGLATLAKRAARDTTEGIVVSKASADGKTTAMATLCCETDFVAKSDDFIAGANLLAEYALACTADEGVENLLETSVKGRKYSEILTEVVSKTGEKVKVGDYVKYKVSGSGFINVYIHFNNKIGTMVQFETSDDKVGSSEAVRQAANDIAMHITAVSPLSLDKDGIDPETIKQERDIYAEQVKNKPANIVDKIVEGKMQKFFADNCLLSQPFVKDNTKTVADVIAEAEKKAGGKAKIKKFVRLGVG